MTRQRNHGKTHWLPSDQDALDAWLSSLLERVTKQPAPLHPVVQDLQTLIEHTPRLYMLFNKMFEDLPDRPPYDTDPTGAPQIRDYRTMMQMMNAVTTAPEFNESGSVGLPLSAVLDWAMGTGPGTAAFLDDQLNVKLRALLSEWARFLGSPDSCYVLNEDPRSGWFGADAMAAMPGFDEQYLCDPSRPHRGFRSWDDFFTRQFRPGMRPVAAPGDPAVIVNACEAAPYRLSSNVKALDRFWLKRQPYSLQHMLDSDPLTEQFVGGTVYQAFLNALGYHHWHSPVAGTVVKTRLIPGTYYAQAHAEGLDPSGLHNSQGYLTEVATRALIFLQAENPDIGLMCFMAVGMAEVSTCDIRAYKGQHLAKGDPLGMFHYGGSTYCLLFRNGVQLDFDLHGQEPSLNSKNILVNQRIATVRAR